jgi:CubicO group peptidase (beta-lactamase class C family)
MLEGEVHPDFAGVAKSLERILPRRVQGGAAVCVYHRGRKVVDIWGGTRDSKGQPWQEDTLSLSFSTTKGVASTLLHVCADRGLLDYDAPVAEVWPEFGQAGKHAITLRQLMCHEAGLHRATDVLRTPDDMLDWATATRKLAEAEPQHVPGESHGYHALTYGWLAGEVARRVMGDKPFAELIERELAQPLALDGLYCGLPAGEEHRVAELMSPLFAGSQAERLARTERIKHRVLSWSRRLSALGLRYDPTEAFHALIPAGMVGIDLNSPEFHAASVPAANGLFTARSLARLYACLAGGGELDGTRLVSSERVRLMSEIQNRGMGRVIPLPMHWRLGYHRVAALGARVPRGFGHFGFGGSGAWADPSRELAVALTVNSGVGTPFGDLRIVRIGGAAVRCADRR